MTGSDAGLDRRLVPTNLLSAARAVVVHRGQDTFSSAIDELELRLSGIERLPPPILAVIVRKGRVQALVSDHPEVLAPMLYDAVVLDYDEECGMLVAHRDGRVSFARVTSQMIHRADFGLAELVEELDQIARDKKR